MTDTKIRSIFDMPPTRPLKRASMLQPKLTALPAVSYRVRGYGNGWKS